MKYVFMRDYVAAGGVGFLAGQGLTEGVLTSGQVDGLIRDGIILEQISMQDFENAVSVPQEIEDLDPEQTVRKPRKK